MTIFPQVSARKAMEILHFNDVHELRQAVLIYWPTLRPIKNGRAFIQKTDRADISALLSGNYEKTLEMSTKKALRDMPDKKFMEFVFMTNAVNRLKKTIGKKTEIEKVTAEAKACFGIYKRLEKENNLSNKTLAKTVEISNFKHIQGKDIQQVTLSYAKGSLRKHFICNLVISAMDRINPKETLTVREVEKSMKD